MDIVEFSICLIAMLTLIVSAFISGLHLSNYYHRKASEDKEYALQKQFVRLQAGTDADDPAGPYVSQRTFEASPEFEQRFREKGRATVSISKSS